MTAARVVGIDAVLRARREWPDLLPQLHPIVVRAPSPPMLAAEWPEQQKVDFLVEAYLTFAQLHCPPAALPRVRMVTLAARRGEGRAAAARGKLAEAARVMCGLGWGELEQAVGSGKLPREVAPHSWLLWSVSARIAAIGVSRFRPLGGFPSIDSVFSPGRLLSSETLRVYSHTAADLAAGSSRPGDTWAAQARIGAAFAAAQAREAAIYRLGFDSRAGCEAAVASLGGCLAGQDLRELDAEERRRASGLERDMAALAERGTWVWGCWLDTSPAAQRKAVA